jgi:flagellar basal body-associated protein FliL
MPPSAPARPLPQTQSTLPPVAVAPPKKKSKLPLILGILAVLLVLGAGAAVAAFFLLIKPRLDQMKSERPVVVRPAQNENVNSNANTTVEAPKTEAEKTESEFVAPPNTTKFTNSQANLDGKLAEQYVDFSFYYPDDWVVDTKAGTAGSGNFAKVERRLPPDFTQENFAVRPYASKGTYASDLPSYSAQVEEFSASLAKVFPKYRKVSEGPTKINSLDAYEFRWVGVSEGTVKGDLQLWGRVVFVPTGVEGDKTGAILSMFTTSLAPELSGVEDVGEKGQAPVILDSFRFGKK